MAPTITFYRRWLPTRRVWIHQTHFRAKRLRTQKVWKSEKNFCLLSSQLCWKNLMTTCSRIWRKMAVNYRLAIWTFWSRSSSTMTIATKKRRTTWLKSRSKFNLWIWVLLLGLTLIEILTKKSTFSLSKWSAMGFSSWIWVNFHSNLVDFLWICA